MVQGSLIGLIGTFSGLLMGLFVALNLQKIVPMIERILGFEAMPADVYYISDLPSQVVWSDVGLVIAVSIAFSLLATLYPAWRASRTQPAEALRYE